MKFNVNGDVPGQKKLLYFFVIILFTFSSFYLSAQTPSESKALDKVLDGKWYGVMEAQGRKIPIFFRIRQNEKLQYDGLLSSGAYKGPIDSIEYNKGDVKFIMSQIGAGFEGKMDPLKKKLVGKWKQAGAAIDLTLDKIDQIPVNDPRLAPPPPKKVVLGEEASNALKGKWYGVLELPQKKIPLLATITSDEKFQCEGILNETHPLGPNIPMDNIEYKNGNVKFSSSEIGAMIEGNMDTGKTKITGTFYQGGLTLPFTLEKVDKIPENDPRLAHKLPKKIFLDEDGAKTLEGKWYGILSETQEKKTPLVYSIIIKEKLQCEGILSGPLSKVAVDEIQYKNGDVKFGISEVGAVFEGKIDPGKTKITGSFAQGGKNFPLILEKIANDDPRLTHKRPQTPQKPYPYDEEEVTIENKTANVTLSGTLTTPREKGPFPAALLITGSGAQDRDETLYDHRPFLVLSDYLTRRGIAVLRVDDRGTGKSTGIFAKATTLDYAADTKACFEFLLKHPKINSQKIGLIGHSEGGLVAPFVASETPQVSFVVLMAGMGIKGDDFMTLQRIALQTANGAKQEDIDFWIELAKKLDRIVIENENIDTRISKLKEFVSKTSLPEKQQKGIVSDSLFYSPWYRQLLTLDPVPAWKKVKCPVLALNGEKDMQVPYKENLGSIENALTSGGNKNVTIKHFPHLNHLFQTASSGVVEEYVTIEETIAPVVLEAIADWIKTTVMCLK